MAAERAAPRLAWSHVSDETFENAWMTDPDDPFFDTIEGIVEEDNGGWAWQWNGTAHGRNFGEEGFCSNADEGKRLVGESIDRAKTQHNDGSAS